MIRPIRDRPRKSAVQFKPERDRIKIVIEIPDWMERCLAWPVLLYRRIHYGYAFRRIPLTKGKFAIVDPDDYYWLSRYKWNLGRTYKTFYAKRKVTLRKNSRQTTIYMHRCIMKAPVSFVVDHINHNGLDNRKANLRIATRAQNSRNSQKTKNKFSSDYKGLFYHRRIRRWRVRITAEGRSRYIGDFKDEIEAAKAYDNAARKYHGEFASLNFPELATKRHRIGGYQDIGESGCRVSGN